METVEAYRSREIVTDDALQTLLNSLTLDQVRSAVEMLSPTKKIPLKSRKDSFEALLRTRQSIADIQTALLDIEASAPFRHCLFSRLQGTGVTSRALELRPNQDRQSRGFGLRVVHVIKSTECVSITLEHSVKVREWVKTSSNTKLMQESRTRHPILVRLYAEQGIVAFFYPGFSQGSGTPRGETISYEELLNDAQAFISELLNVSFSALPIRECIKVFVEGENSRVRVVRSDVEATSGRVALSSTYQDKPVEQVLVDYLGNLSPEIKALILDLGRKALGTALANSVVLFWFDEKVVTRLQFWNIGTDMLFVWHGVPNSFRIVEEIVNLFRMTYQMLPSKDTASPLDWLSKMAPGTMVRPAELSAQFSISIEESRFSLVTSMKIGLLQPVYRLRTDALLIDNPNEWTSDPSELNREFEADGGDIIDGRDPRNIEVAFLRIDTGSAV